MFHVPYITENVTYASLAERIRNSKLFIPVSIVVIAYTAAIIAVILSMAKMEVTEEMRAAAAAQANGGQAPNSANAQPNLCPVLPDQNATEQTTTAAPTTNPPCTCTAGSPPATNAPQTATLPPVGVPPVTLPPGTLPPVTVPPVTVPPATLPPLTLPPVTVPPVTVPPVTIPPVTLPPVGPTTKAPTGPTTPAPATTKAPTTAAPTTRAPTTAAPTTTPAATPAPVTTAPTGTLHPPAELGGKRGFCFRNSCSETIWVGQIGASTGIKCSAGCPKGTICNPDLDLGCYFSLPFPASKAKLEPGKFFCLAFDYDPITTNIYMPDGTVIHLEVQWSGAIFASTKCDDQLNCATGICKECTLTECHECPSYRGPVGPVTQGEMTLSGIWKDYYDTTLIHGANLPLVIKPMTYQPNFWPDQYQKPAYHCGAPGSPYTVGDSPGATWQFKRLPTQTDKQLARPLVTGGSKASCVGGKACPTGEVCGISMGLTERNQPRADIGDTVCGIPAGIWSRSELCGWTDSWAFEDCKTSPSPNSGTMQKLYKCDTPHHESCFQPNVDTKCCGCTVWPDFIPTHGEDCKNHNPVWEQTVMPHLEQIKRACPTCYTYPYDDSTALYTCWDDELWNAASYEFEWCPAKTTVAY